VTSPASAAKKNDEDSWGAWGTKTNKTEEKKKVTTAMMNKKEPPVSMLVNLDAPVAVNTANQAQTDGWDDWAFMKK
jgi:hypothetical protein